MPLRKPAGKRRSTDSGVEPDRGALSQEKKDQRIALFLSDFDQQAQENIQEMKKELDSLLQTAEKAFAVELLKMPVAIRNMKRKDLLHLQGGEEVALAAAVLRSVNTSASVTEASKSLASDCSATNFKGTTKASKSAGLQQTVSRTVPTSGRAQGMLLRSKSVPQDKAVPFVNIPLADGQTLCTAGGDLHNIDVQLLNQDTVQHIHNLVSELTVLCGKATAKPS